MPAAALGGASAAPGATTGSRGEGRGSPRRSRLSLVGASVVMFVRVMRANLLTLVGFILTVLIVVTAAAVALVPAIGDLFHLSLSVLPYPPNQLFTGPVFSPPSPAHLFGTDSVGRDLFSRVLSALPIDLGIGVSIAGFSVLLGGSLGLIAGYWDRPWTLGGVQSLVIMRVTDVFLSVPSLILALAISEVLGRGTVQSELAVMATWWPYYVRLTRGEVLAIKNQPYIVAARAAGVSDGRILFRHVLRNLLEPLLVYFTMDIGTVIVTYSTISYIGIGVPPSIPEWGNMIQAYQDNLVTQPWLVGSVAAAIFVTVLAFSLLGDGLRDILDPRSRRILAASAPGQGGTKLAAASPGGSDS
ncbi:MAG TPA: ABC transporter permease [Thermoplasmata archaeon]|nr:ABC transporter permease [Thermoplasmata archaeon]